MLEIPHHNQFSFSLLSEIGAMKERDMREIKKREILERQRAKER